MISKLFTLGTVEDFVTYSEKVEIMEEWNPIPVHLAYLHYFGDTTECYPFPGGGIQQT